MIQVLTWQTQYLNGCNVIKKNKNQQSHYFKSKEEMEDWRKLKELKIQYKNPEVEVKVLLTYREL